MSVEKRIMEFLYRPVDFRLLTILPMPASRAYNKLILDRLGIISIYCDCGGSIQMMGRDADASVEVQVLLWRLGNWPVC